jgi:hypothetical protein
VATQDAEVHGAFLGDRPGVPGRAAGLAGRLVHGEVVDGETAVDRGFDRAGFDDAARPASSRTVESTARLDRPRTPPVAATTMRTPSFI